ncbi:MAG: N-acetylneuraminate synthase [Methylococcaceae bacterium]|nr:N-acetylneuraminate synthase [Methylococcaceae bacterium]
MAQIDNIVRLIVSKRKVMFIAEAGVNHNGDIEMAKKLIDVAAEAGADYVKFQTYKTEQLVTQTAEQAAYQKENTGGEETQFAMLKRLELKYEDHYVLKAYAESKHIKFLSTAFDEESIAFLFKLGIDFFKVPSGEITNYFYLRNIAQKGLPIVLSTGMSDMEDIRNAVKVLLDFGVKKADLVILHCNSQYPSPIEDVNLSAMLTIQKAFDVAVGYSDHTAGLDVSIAAVAMGAVVIEKHFTLDKNLPGPDHKASLEPDELKQYVQQIRSTELLLGNGIKQPSNSERVNMSVGRKSLHAKTAIKKGNVLSEDNVFACRPGNGISPMEWEKLKGKVINTSIEKMQVIYMTDLVLL